VRRVYVSKNRFATVDDALYKQIVSAGPWHLTDNGYAENSQHRRMHRFVMKLTGTCLGRRKCDHKDRRKLNNQRQNLRVATAAQNGRNRGPNHNNSSGYKGVGRGKTGWTAEIKVDRRKQHLGTFHSATAAARAYDDAARQLHGDFAYTNLPDRRKHERRVTESLIKLDRRSGLDRRGMRVWNTNSSGFRGVSHHRLTGKWRASITIHGLQKHLGLFDTKVEAADAYVEALKARRQ
jgi:hypothetical protein